VSNFDDDQIHTLLQKVAINIILLVATILQ